MQIGIVGGTGKEGRGLGLRWARAGHTIAIGSRRAARGVEAASALSEQAGVAIGGGDNAWAVSDAEVVVLSVPYSAHRDTLVELAPAVGERLIIDITVPLAPPRVREVHLPEGHAAALEAQAILGERARVVAALHHLSSVHLADVDHALDTDVLVCADDPDARARAMALIEDLGVRAIDAGVLRNAIALESLTPVLLHINQRYKISGAGLRITGIPDRDRTGRVSS